MKVTVTDPRPRMTVTVQDGPTFTVQPTAKTVTVVTAAGPQGPAGQDGALAPYTHTQSAAAASWLITHNLGRYPQVSVVDTAGDLLLTDVTYTALNSVTVTFAAPTAGVAYLT